MREIKVTRPDEEWLEKHGVREWPIWTKDPSVFDWYYDSEEHCLILEGKVTVREGAQEVHLKPGDYVVFPKGLSCNWEVEEPVRKHYKFV